MLSGLAGKGVAEDVQRAGGVVINNHSEDKATLLAIDNYALPLRKDLCYYLSKPTVRPEPVLSPSRDNPHATDYVATHFYGTVLQDGGKFRMWYYSAGWVAKPGETIQEGPICYAESDDGIRWTKPNLGQVEYKGSRDNNAIALPIPRLKVHSSSRTTTIRMLIGDTRWSTRIFQAIGASCRYGWLRAPTGFTGRLAPTRRSRKGSSHAHSTSTKGSTTSTLNSHRPA